VFLGGGKKREEKCFGFALESTYPRINPGACKDIFKTTLSYLKMENTFQTNSSNLSNKL